MKRLHTYAQHFLRSPRLVAELIGHSGVKKTDLVLDIGAGSGVISAVLASRCREVVAIEAEPRTAAKLRDNMAKFSNVTVYEGDFLTMTLPNESYKIFANIPFHLSSQIVHKITEAIHPPDATYLIVQKQFAHKLLPDSDRFSGQLGMMIGPLFAVRIRRPLRRTDFWPHPAVDTVLLEIKHRDEPLIALGDIQNYRKFIEGCFSDPKIFAKTPYEQIGLPSDIKPSQMKLNDWTRLYSLSKTR